MKENKKKAKKLKKSTELKLEAPVTQKIQEEIIDDSKAPESNDDLKPTAESNNEEVDDTEKPGERKYAYDKEDERKTVFCGNIPTNLNRGKLKELFSKFGSVKSIRLRSESGNILFSKKNKALCKSFIAFVVFEEEECARKSVELNGFKLLDNHLRVNMANEKQETFKNKGTIFVGNLPFESTEAQLNEYFSQIGNIEYVRIIPKKGVAYVCFAKGVSIVNALKLDGHDFNGRKLRISRSESREKQDRKNLFKKDPKTGKLVKKKLKKAHKINDDFIKGRPNIKNPIVAKIKSTQKAKYNRFTDSDQMTKRELFRRGGKMDRENREVNREKIKKKQKFFGSKVDDAKKKIKKGKVSKNIKEQKLIAKKLKSAALRVKS